LEVRVGADPPRVVWFEAWDAFHLVVHASDDSGRINASRLLTNQVTRLRVEQPRPPARIRPFALGGMAAGAGLGTILALRSEYGTDAVPAYAVMMGLLGAFPGALVGSIHGRFRSPTHWVPVYLPLPEAEGAAHPASGPPWSPRGSTGPPHLIIFPVGGTSSHDGHCVRRDCAMIGRGP
jgi:hypothetical protein